LRRSRRATGLTLGRRPESRTKAIAAAVGTIALLTAILVPGPAGAEPLRLGISTWVGYGPFFLARKKGYYKEQGLELDLVKIEDVKVRFAALAAGRIDAMATTVDTLPLYLRPRGIRYQYLFAIDGSRGGDGVVADKEITSVAELEGKRVAFAEGSVSQFFLNVLLAEAGLEQSDIQTVHMSARDAGSAFVSGKVDAAVTWEPWLTRGKRASHGRLLADSSEKPALITNVILAPAKTVRDREAEMKTLYRGWNRAVEFVGANPAEAYAIMAKGLGGWLKTPAAFAEAAKGMVYYDAAMNEALFGTDVVPGELSRTIQQALDIWSDLGKLKVSVRPRDLVNYSVVD
jgi:NitT/TauT family transport system substrate-binding protein